ncbi:MAG: PilZ domain-containing protein [Pseudomonadota bacterium]
MQQTLERRHSPIRRKTQVPAEVFSAGVPMSAVIENVSFDGMNLSLPHNLAYGTPVAICFFGKRIGAVVQWSRGRQAGVRLVERLSGQTLIALEKHESDA